ncbi:MAG: hypothetical protein WBW69_03575, partial [Candidatus Korobacteraceae bacterium]
MRAFRPALDGSYQGTTLVVPVVSNYRWGFSPCKRYGAPMAKEKFDRSKPHVNVGTIGHID